MTDYTGIKITDLASLKLSWDEMSSPYNYIVPLLELGQMRTVWITMQYFISTYQIW